MFGMNFAHEARAMHSGESPNRAIYGEAQGRGGQGSDR